MADVCCRVGCGRRTVGVRFVRLLVEELGGTYVAELHLCAEDLPTTQQGPASQEPSFEEWLTKIKLDELDDAEVARQVRELAGVREVSRSGWKRQSP